MVWTNVTKGIDIGLVTAVNLLSKVRNVNENRL